MEQNQICPYCNEKIKEITNSLHVWVIEYNCGYKIFGAINSETDINILTSCKNKKIMSLQERIKSDLESAIFKRKSSSDFLKVIVAEMSRKESKILSDEEVFKILKMMKEGATILNNEFELEILKEYLPEMMGEEETKYIVRQIIDEYNFSTMKDLGKLMKCLSTFGPTLDKSIASKYAKEFLS